MEINIELFDKICRVCLIQSTSLKSLFSKVDGDERNLFEILSFTANIDVKIEDSLPKQVCNSCESIMCKADEFKRRCRESETILSNILRTTKSNGESTNIASQCKIKDEKVELKQKLIEYGTLLSPISKNDGDKDDFDSKDLILLDLPACSTKQVNLNKLSTSGTVESFDHTVKKEVDNNFDDDNFLNSFDDAHMDDTAIEDNDKQFEVPIKNVVQKSKKVKNNSKKIGVRYECYCRAQFTTEETYKSHLDEKKCNNKNEDDVLPECRKCNKQFSTMNAWKGHRRRHHQDENRGTEVFQCSLCLRKFKHKESYTAHLQRHEIRDSIKHVCEICKREFKYKAYLENHILATHSKTNEFACEECAQSFPSKETLETHKKSHENDKKHRCNVCNKGFYMLCTLKEHIRTHTGEKPFLCSECGKGFSQKTNLAQHMRRHQGLKPFKCESCDKGFVSKGELDAHTRKHSGAHPFVCDECGNGFTTSSALVKHRRIHTGERPYQCDLCPMKFAASGTLKNHRRTHTGERPYQCSYCEKAFVQRNDLISHIRCHTGERPYICTQCGQSFRKASGLKSHVKMHIKDPIVGVNALLTSMHCTNEQ